METALVKVAASIEGHRQRHSPSIVMRAPDMGLRGGVTVGFATWKMRLGAVEIFGTFLGEIVYSLLPD